MQPNLFEEILLESVTLSSIHVARARIGEAIHMSPCHLSHHLSELTGLPLHLKLENLQRSLKDPVRCRFSSFR